ncbi:outer membrane lipoprotein chaperone LolA [Neptuniibacter sp. QD72_48]|uniref:outer membrane lipoprotein chaperone LolA n=1 Tax=unclassified Neptuniibacter TaxID=2630693 RepID=UPI0039F71E95
MRFTSYIKKFVIHTASACLIAGTSVAMAATDGANKLNELLQGYDSFSAKFEQVTLAENGREAQKTEGSLLLAKPNRFRWETQQPFPQEIVSDGEYIWIYDPDLEQVTQRAADTQQDSAPALILNGQIGELQKTYAVRLIEDTGSEQIFDLKPLSDQYSFSRIRLAFAGNVISELMLEDSLGQRTSVVFAEQTLNPEVTNQSFYFRVPEGTDVIVDIEE